MTANPTELDQASAERRSFGNPALAANAEFKVIAEALRELVNEVRLIRVGLDAPRRASSALAALSNATTPVPATADLQTQTAPPRS